MDELGNVVECTVLYIPSLIIILYVSSTLWLWQN